MSKIYVDEILPKDNAKITAADLQLPAGSVIQVEQDLFSTTYSTTSSSDTSFRTFTFTPKLASSKILLRANFFARVTSSNGYGFAYFLCFVNGTNVWTGYPIIGSTNGASDLRSPVTFEYLHTTGTTDPITYEFKFKASYTDGTVYVNSGTVPSAITVEEIAQ